MSQSIDIPIEYLDLIKEILHKHLPSHTKVSIFGSRATGRAKPFSDIDLFVDLGKPLSLQQLAVLNAEFDESLLPYKVDIADAHAISDSFRLAIQQQLIPV